MCARSFFEVRVDFLDKDGFGLQAEPWWLAYFDP